MHVLVNTRPPAVAGSFYPGDADTLRRQLGAMLAAVGGNGVRPKALICPHAGTIYSGPIAASAYARLAPWADEISRVVLLGPCHRVAVRGIAVPSVAAFATPLGDIAIDDAARRQLADLPQVLVADAPHAPEHSLELQLPFLQLVLGDFTLLPLAVGHVAPAAVAEVIDRLWGGRETLIVVSSDLSHFHPYQSARAIDRATCDEVLAMNPHLDHEQACGATPINGLLLAARRRGLPPPQLLDLRNSGDTAGDRGRVVGYAAFAFAEQP